MTDTLSVAYDGPLAVVTIGDGDEPGAMTAAFFSELAETFARLDREDAVRAVVLAGASRGFSYGLDLTEAVNTLGHLLESADASDRVDLLNLIRAWQAAVTAVAVYTKPTVAAISGWCVGGGVDLAAACDVRIASADATFSVREARMAIVADLGSLQRLVGIIGDGHLRELALTGDDIDADRACTIGLVNHVLPDPAAALESAIEMGRRMAANSPLVLRGIKDVLDSERGPRVEAGLRYVAVWNAAFLPSHDLAEAFEAFKERRTPNFTGR